MASVSLRIDLAGRVTSGADEIEFEVVSGTADDVETTDADLSVNGDELYVIGVLDENVTTGEVEVDVSLMAEGDSLRLRSHWELLASRAKSRLTEIPSRS